jgi:hypothetical protein
VVGAGLATERHSVTARLFIEGEFGMTDRDGDQQVLRALASNGSNLGKPAHTIHYLYFKSLLAAKCAAGVLTVRGFQNVRYHRAPTKSLWTFLFGPREYSCIAETRYVPSEANVFAATDQMKALADQFDGVYDGWEASIER